MSFTRLGNSVAGSVARKEAIELNYVFDFDATETVVYTGAGPFPGRVFVLNFWRHAKDGVMHLLGYRKQGHWRNPTLCYPDSYVRYYRPQHPAAHPQPGGREVPGHEQPQDTTQQRPQRPASVEQLAYRVPLLELDHGVWELPTLRGKPIQVIDSALRFSKPPKANISRQRHIPPPPLNKPVDRVIEFVSMSTHFEHLSQAEQELAKLLKVLKQFPQLQVTVQGNYQMSPGYLVRGYGPYPRYEQERRTSPYITKWPSEVESYTSIGQVMDARARTIQQYLIRHGIDARRVHTARGQFSDRKTFTIIFSN